MTKSYREGMPITASEFVDQLMRLRRGSISRRHFLGATGLGVATAVLGRELGFAPAPAYAAGELGDKVSLATWPNYHDPKTFETFREKTGVAVEVNVFGSNEEMLAKLQAGATGWSLFVPTNYTISTYKKLGIIEPIDLSKVPSFDAASEDPRFTSEGTVDGTVFALPKNWGTTGYVVNTNKITKPMTTWKDF